MTTPARMRPELSPAHADDIIFFYYYEKVNIYTFFHTQLSFSSSPCVSASDSNISSLFASAPASSESDVSKVTLVLATEAYFSSFSSVV